MRFERAPLIELVAEFRWLPTNSLGQQITDYTHLGMSGPETEAFYEKLRAALAKEGYAAAERLVPNGFPYPMQQPVFRYLRAQEANTSEIFQVGMGIFTVHALPPYENWDHFKPIISQGLRALIEARDTRTHSEPTAFTRISLRYINAFGKELIGGRSMTVFLNEVLGITLQIPTALSQQLQDVQRAEVSLNISADTKSGLNFTMAIGRNAKFEQAVIVDLTAATASQTEWNCDGSMEVLSEAHNSIRSMFLAMTVPIHELMGLSEKS